MLKPLSHKAGAARRTRRVLTDAMQARRAAAARTSGPLPATPRAAACHQRAGRVQEVSMGRLDGKVAIITGAGSGQGLAAARLFANEGASVVVGEYNEETGARAAEEIAAAGGLGG